MLETSPKRIALVLNSLTGKELTGGKQDVEKVYSILSDPQQGMCLKNGSTQVKDCKSRESFEKTLRSTLKDWHIKTQLVFYFSGHGDIRNNLYCLKMGLDNSEWYPFKHLMTELDLAGVKRAIIILDTCYSGAALEGSKNLDGNIFNHINQDDISQGIAIIASSRKTQKSQELPDGSSGVFTDIFCTGIKTSLDGKGTNDGNIYVEDIVNYINHKLETEEKYSKFPQRSVFSLNRAEKKIWIAKGKKRKDSTALYSQDSLEKIVQELITRFIQSQSNITDAQIADLTKFVKDIQNELTIDVDLKLDKELKPFYKGTLVFLIGTYAKIVGIGRRCSMKPYFYILAGITSALLGWNIGQLFLSDFGLFTLLAEIGIFPEIILFPSVSISLAMGSVTNEIFLSNPTRPKVSLRTLPVPLFIALSIGILSGLIAAGISQILLAPEIAISPFIVRVCSWLLVGASVGFAEGLSWGWRSIQVGNPKYFRQRLFLSLFAASIASLIAASTFELVRIIQETMPATSKPYEDPFGFAILGLCLGIAFSITNFTPSYMPALRAGSGFEYSEEEYHGIDPRRTVPSRNYPRIDSSILKFISYRSQYEPDEDDRIEEGLSIELPKEGIIRIGSSDKARIHLPHLPLHAADIRIKRQNVVLDPNPKFFNSVAINGTRLSFHRKIPLKHNYVLTFYTNSQDDNIEVPERYCMIFYNRFFDPMA